MTLRQQSQRQNPPSTVGKLKIIRPPTHNKPPQSGLCIPTATGDTFYTFNDKEGSLVGSFTETNQLVPQKKHRHLVIKPNPSGARISYSKLVKGKILGRGAQGEVQEVTYAGKAYALKRLQVMLGKGKHSAVQRELEQVVLDLTKLNNHTVQSYDAYWSEKEGKLCILMELMHHGSLIDVLSALSTAPPRGCYPRLSTLTNETFPCFCIHDVSYIALRVAKGLVELQSLGLVHNDIKPANILVNEAGDIKIGDFGVARWTDTCSIVATGSGTQWYMAPERLEMLQYSYPADVYSFGLTIAYCAVGRHPLKMEGASHIEVLMRLSKGVEMCSEYCKEMPPTLCDMLKGCLCPDWQARTQPAWLLEHKFFKEYPPDDTPHFFPVIRHHDS